MELTARLRVIADQVPQGAVLADIGTDHAYLPVWLLLNGRIERAIAADLREGPLSRAKETAAQYGLTHRVSFRLCNGLSDISSEEANVISIAGMGGETIVSILSDAPWTKNGSLLLLQPMTSFTDLRLWLQQNGYCIEKEILAQEGRRLYSCLCVRAGNMPQLSPAELWVGRQNGDPLRPAFLSHMRGKAERALSGHLAATAPNEAEISFLRDVIEGIHAMEGELDS